MIRAVFSRVDDVPAPREAGAGHELVVPVEFDDAALGVDERQHEVVEIACIERGRVHRQAPRHVDVADDAHPAMLDDLARARQRAVAALLHRQIHDDAAGFADRFFPAARPGADLGRVARSREGCVAAVEVSVDGGATWHPAEGREAWRYEWKPEGSGNRTIRCRAVDDSGNLEAPAASSLRIRARRTPPFSWRCL